MGRPVIRVVLVRHGATVWNQEGRYPGHTDVGLSTTGRAQAERLGGRLASEAIGTAFSSDLARARETAEIALAGRSVPVTTDAHLREACFGSWEGLRYDEIAQRYPGEWQAWVRDPARTRPPGGGESLQDLRTRVTAAFDRMVASALGSGIATRADPRPFPSSPSREGEDAPRDWFSYRAAGASAASAGATLLVVTHGGPLRALLTHVFDMPVDLYWRFGIRPASVTILEVYPEGAVAEVVGDTSHL